uniref:F-box/LRR-repeat protein 15-like leucin rich repeat domain-containing protein n=1 Tax=Oryza barthii TaxID=65489 RepID=A0A0D3HKC9_9ORYZ
MDDNVENYINFLSDDCLICIFNKLESESDRNAFGLTCKNWFKVRNIARKSIIFHCSFNPKVYKEHANCLSKLLARSPYLNLVSLAGLTELPDAALNQLRISGASLQSLSFYCCSDQGIAAIFRNCPNISTIIIAYCRGLSGVGFRGCPGTLSHLEAESCMLSPDGLLDVVSGGGLEYLNLYNLKSPTGLDGLDRVGYARSLRFLNVRMCRYLTDDSVTAIASGCPLIEEWSLAVCHGVRLPGWSAIGLLCNKLRILHVNRCRNICDQGLQALGDGCVCLQVLHIHGCGKITNNGLASFSIARPNVKQRADEVMCIGPSIEDLFRLQ